MMAAFETVLRADANAGKVVLVTGGGTGIGKATAAAFVATGARVAIASRRTELLEAAADELRTIAGGSGQVQVVTADIREPDQVVSLVDAVLAESGHIDVLVNNAGLGMRPFSEDFMTDPVKFWETSIPQVQATFDTNVMGTFHMAALAVPHMVKQGWGRIVNVSSGAGVSALTSMECYGIAKAGIIHYTRSLAKEMAPHGINVNCLAPALIETSRAFAQFPSRRDAGKNIPMGRVGVPEDCAKVVEFFCTDLSDYVTGQVLGICGGLILQAI